jgi:hypothetical protein
MTGLCKHEPMGPAICGGPVSLVPCQFVDENGQVFMGWMPYNPGMIPMMVPTAMQQFDEPIAEQTAEPTAEPMTESAKNKKPCNIKRKSWADMDMYDDDARDPVRAIEDNTGFQSGYKLGSKARRQAKQRAMMDDDKSLLERTKKREMEDTQKKAEEVAKEEQEKRERASLRDCKHGAKCRFGKCWFNHPPEASTEALRNANYAQYSLQKARSRQQQTLCRNGPYCEVDGCGFNHNECDHVEAERAWIERVRR